MESNSEREDMRKEQILLLRKRATHDESALLLYFLYRCLMLCVHWLCHERSQEQRFASVHCLYWLYATWVSGSSLAPAAAEHSGLNRTVVKGMVPERRCRGWSAQRRTQGTEDTLSTRVWGRKTNCILRIFQMACDESDFLHRTCITMNVVAGSRITGYQDMHNKDILSRKEN